MKVLERIESDIVAISFFKLSVDHVIKARKIPSTVSSFPNHPPFSSYSPLSRNPEGAEEFFNFVFPV